MESPTEWVRGQTIGHGSFAIVSLAKPTSQSSGAEGDIGECEASWAENQLLTMPLATAQVYIKKGKSGNTVFFYR
ncbi:hypothetical protein L2E82_48097 [Cichorium intybus]|uniref:Uncharacterized protein n=1 Tax=Cichorium intybus TaxID=13427 RepID=A0ACB8YX81_CICIN|nr:hypothetical protein L2E82_48097 [Cichorium intybus]